MMNFEKKNYIYKMTMMMIVTVLVTFLITVTGTYHFFVKTKNTELDLRIQEVRSEIDRYYFGEIDEEELLEYAIKGYVVGLGDEYTQYFTKEEYEELMVEVNGNFVGIGIYMTQDRYGNIVVLLPIEGSPAEEAGLKTGDIIAKVDGEECAGKELSVIANKVKGEEGTKVNLEIKREDEIINKTIERRTVEINHIETEILENDIGYIQILSFDDSCSKEFENKLEDLKNKGIKSLIIDVRDNGGGIVTEATDIADLFLEKNKIIMRELNKEGKEEIVKSKKDPVLSSDFNIVILANENSASATEIFIGALKDNNVAKVVGTRTFGKGVMQGIIPLESGGALKLTTEEFRTPNGNIINKEGILPDIEIEDIEDNDIDEQLEKAIEELKK